MFNMITVTDDEESGDEDEDDDGKISLPCDLEDNEPLNWDKTIANKTKH